MVEEYGMAVDTEEVVLGEDSDGETDSEEAVDGRRVMFASNYSTLKNPNHTLLNCNYLTFKFIYTHSSVILFIILCPVSF